VLLTEKKPKKKEPQTHIPDVKGKLTEASDQGIYPGVMYSKGFAVDKIMRRSLCLWQQAFVGLQVI